MIRVASEFTLPLFSVPFGRNSFCREERSNKRMLTHQKGWNVRGDAIFYDYTETGKDE